jgi:hypothetical protein
MQSRRLYRSLSILAVSLCVALLAAATGCTATIPYKIVDAQALRRSDDRKVIVHMDEGLHQLTSEQSPSSMPGTMSYAFQVGAATSANLLAVLNAHFGKAELSTAPLESISGYDYVIDVHLDDMKFDLGLSVYAEHTTSLQFTWKLYDRKRKLLLTTTTLGKGSSTTNDATANVVLDVMFNTNRSARNYEDAMGRALDSALASNLVQITRALDQYESQARQAKAGEAAPPRDAAAQESGPP